MQVVCGHCLGVNRVPDARLSDDPRCGRCQSALFNAQPVAADDDASLATHLQRNELPVLVDFWAEWCGPCKVMAPHFARAAADLEPQLRLLKTNTELTQASAAQWTIRSIPTLILFAGGREIARKSGAMEAQVIVAWTHHHLSGAV